MDVKNEIFWSEKRLRFGELCGTPPPRISRSTSPPHPLPSTAAQIALKHIRRKRNQHQISIFIYLFILSPLPYKHLSYCCAKHAVIFRSQDRHAYNENILLTSL